MIAAFPLAWPLDRARTPSRTNSKFDLDRTFGRIRDDLLHELKLLGASDIVLSTNVPLRRDGLPYANENEPNDPGVAVYFNRGKVPYVMACDTYRRVRENMRAVSVTVEALRTISRHGAGQMLESAFTGFTALPPAHRTDPPWQQVLGILSGSSLEAARAAFKALVFQHHPDRGGDRERFEQITRAWEAAQKAGLR